MRYLSSPAGEPKPSLLRRRKIRRTEAGKPRTRKRLPGVFYFFFLLFFLLSIGVDPIIDLYKAALQSYQGLSEQWQSYRETGSSPRAPEAGVESAAGEDSASLEPVADQQETPLAGILELSVNEVFRPVGFVIDALSHPLPLLSRPEQPFRRLPRFQGGQQRYGVIELNRGQAYRFVLDIAGDQAVLHLDRNRNGDLTDDGEPILNRGDELFANQIALPMRQVTGLSGMDGEYLLWLFSTPATLEENSLRLYAMTQLSGELRLDGEPYRAYLADNYRLDGDYTNDGLSIDLNADGRIDAVEYLPPGGQIMIGNRRYGVHITP